MGSDAAWNALLLRVMGLAETAGGPPPGAYGSVVVPELECGSLNSAMSYGTKAGIRANVEAGNTLVTCYVGNSREDNFLNAISTAVSAEVLVL